MVNINDEQLIQDFGQDCKDRNLTQETIVAYTSTLRIFQRYMRGQKKDLLQINEDSLIGYIESIHDSGKTVSTLRHHLCVLRAFYDFLLSKGLISMNIVIPIKRMYLSTYEDPPVHDRQNMSIDIMRRLISSIPKPKDRAVVTLLAKTGIRRRELIAIDVQDVDMEQGHILLKPQPKRSNRNIYFDKECKVTLQRWLDLRSMMNLDTDALFVSERKERLKRHGVSDIVTKWTTRARLHDPTSTSIEKKFTPQTFRHFFTSSLKSSGMPREYIQELRGDCRRDILVRIPPHITQEDLRAAYLQYMPCFGII